MKSINHKKRNSKITKKALTYLTRGVNKNIKTMWYDLRLFRPWVPDLG